MSGGMAMTDFSIGDALGAGFGLVKRRPVSVLVWGLTFLLLGVALPMGLIVGLMGSDYLALLRSARPDIAPMSPAAATGMMRPLVAKWLLLQPILLLVGLLLRPVLTAAVFRAVLRPRERGLAYLRLGWPEIWLVLVDFVARILAAMLFVALALAGLIVGFILNAVFQSQNLDWAVRGAAFATLGILLFAIFIGICVRFSMAWPMSFAEGQFRLFESWELTRRHAWKLFGLALLIGLVCAAVGVVCETVAAVTVVLAVGGGHWSQAQILALVQDPRALLTPGLELGLAVGALAGAYLGGALFAIAVAPWAVAYRELLPGARPEPREGGLYVPAPPVTPPEPAPPLKPAPTPVSDPEPEPLPPEAPEALAEDHDHGHADPHADPGERGHDEH